MSWFFCFLTIASVLSGWVFFPMWLSCTYRPLPAQHRAEGELASCPLPLLFRAASSVKRVRFGQSWPSLFPPVFAQTGGTTFGLFRAPEWCELPATDLPRSTRRAETTIYLPFPTSISFHIVLHSPIRGIFSVSCPDHIQIDFRRLYVLFSPTIVTISIVCRFRFPCKF